MTRTPAVVLCPDGPMLLRGDHVVVDEDGTEHRTTRPVSAVCRCGHSALLPWCDGTHKVVRTGYRTAMTTTPQEPAPDVVPLDPDQPGQPQPDPGQEPLPGPERP